MVSQALFSVKLVTRELQNCLHTKKGDVQGLKDSLYYNKCRLEEMFKYATVHNLLEVVSTISVKTIIYVYKITIPFYKFTITSLQIHVIFSTIVHNDVFMSFSSENRLVYNVWYVS